MQIAPTVNAEILRNVLDYAADYGCAQPLTSSSAAALVRQHVVRQV
jgi:hypothetical protein